MEVLASAISDAIRAHALLAPPIVFILAFGESLAFVSLLLPATILLVGASGMISAAGLPFWPIWIAAAVGAVLGDWVSYWLGLHYEEAIAGMWPLSRHPDLLPRGHRFFEKWGVAGVFLGRFFGPLRCIVPLVAGVCGMPWLAFQAANISSGVIWATLVLAPGHLAIRWFTF
ncbi:MAG TPA: DedA family protein [Acetobacteraceae bacterium]|jgi:membrane protein DedA with SNARE-associated domain|nr:DedA family protein [Acetobacteraceae bacterium]